MRGEFPETPCIEQGVVLSFRFAERKVRRAPRVLRMAVVSQSSVKFGKKRVLLVGATNFMTITAGVATSKFETRLVRSNTTCFRGVWLVNCSCCGLQASCGLVG